MNANDSRPMLTVNGERLTLALPFSVSDLLASRGLSLKRIAVERNGEIVPRGLHAQTFLQNGDRIEIVIAVGGG
jgi:sulfur carrier protein